MKRDSGDFRYDIGIGNNNNKQLTNSIKKNEDGIEDDGINGQHAKNLEIVLI